MEFTGFREEAFAFFRELRQNNSVAWFEEHQEDFHQFVQVPFDQLLRTLDEPMRELDEVFALGPVLDAHYSQMHSAASPASSTPNPAPVNVPPLKMNFTAFYWDKEYRRLNDGYLFIRIGADGISLGFSIYDFGAPQGKMQRVFKPRIRRNLHSLDEHIKANYLRRGFEFRRFIRAAGHFGMKEADPFPTGAPEWENTLGWVIIRHIHTDSSRLTPGSFVSEVMDTFRRLYPVYVFTSDPGPDWPKILKVSGIPAVPPPRPPKPKIDHEALRREEEARKAEEKRVLAEARKAERDRIRAEKVEAKRKIAEAKKAERQRIADEKAEAKRRAIEERRKAAEMKKEKARKEAEARKVAAEKKKIVMAKKKAAEKVKAEARKTALVKKKAAAAKKKLAAQKTAEAREKVIARQKAAAEKKKIAARKKAEAKKKALDKAKAIAARKKAASQKKAPAKKKPAARKKPAAKKKKAPARKKAPVKKKTTARKKASAKKKPLTKKKTVARKKTAAKKKPAPKKKPAAKKKAAARKKK